jgi:hypothetical protein
MPAESPRSPQRLAQRPPQRRVIYTGQNRFDFDKGRIPQGMAYAWKRVSIAGQEDTEHTILCEMNGWTPVPGNRHPELTGSRGTEAPIIRGGQMLMEQPAEWEQESRDIDNFTARNLLEEQVQRINAGGKRSGGKIGVRRNMESVAELVE